MKIFLLTRKQFPPITLKEAWDFFSDPNNLALITPAKLAFKIISNSGEKMYAGQRIHYRITIFPGVRVHWITEITYVNEPSVFIDEQRSGPYALWYHVHRFKIVSGGVEMVDELKYAIPLGWLGELVHFLFVKKTVNEIFDYRYATLEKRFGSVS